MSYSALKIGRYTIVKRIAIGGMAEVYHAKVLGKDGIERPVAIKRILPDYAANPDFRKMFEYEAHLSRYLTHPNIVQTSEFTELGSTYLLEMEYIRGVNLKQLTNRLSILGERLTVQWAAYFLREVCKGLEYAHTRKDDNTGNHLHIIHRDMSPQNIMIAFDGSVKIVDFGIAKARNEADHTQNGLIKGKFAYMSPEQANGEPLDHLTDIFSAGISLWELLTGTRLFYRNNDLATLREVKQGEIPKPSSVNPDVPPALDEIVLKALSRDKTARYQSAGELSIKLNEFLTQYSPSFCPSHLRDHLPRLFVVERTAESTKCGSVAVLPIELNEYAGDIFYEASESSITGLHKETNHYIENSFSENSKKKKPSATQQPLEHIPEKNNGLLTFAATTFGIVGILAAVFWLQNFRPLEKPAIQSSFSSPRSIAAVVPNSEPELSQLKVMVNRDVDLYVKKAKVAEAKAFVPVTLHLKGEQKHLIEFRNHKRGIRTARYVAVKSGFINRLDVNIE